MIEENIVMQTQARKAMMFGGQKDSMDTERVSRAKDSTNELINYPGFLTAQCEHSSRLS